MLIMCEESTSLTIFDEGRENMEGLDMDVLKRKLYGQRPVCDVVQLGTCF